MSLTADLAAPARAAEAQTADAVLMVRPAAFGFNPQAAETNHFAHDVASSDAADRARAEFDGLAEGLEEAGVQVLVLEDAAEPAKPDAVFCNNWMSFHADGSAILYPLANPVRRHERRLEDVTRLLRGGGFGLRGWTDLTGEERAERYLESTGSLVLDRPGRAAFACLSGRTHPGALERFCRTADYEPVPFRAFDRDGWSIYHTNVLLSLGRRFAVVCLEAVDAEDRPGLIRRLEESEREPVEITLDQMEAFAGNILELRARSSEPVIAMSTRAYEAYAPAQLRRLERLGGAIVHRPVPVIETVGGGGVRCMLTEVHLPRERVAA